MAAANSQDHGVAGYLKFVPLRVDTSHNAGDFLETFCIHTNKFVHLKTPQEYDN